MRIFANPSAVAPLALAMFGALSGVGLLVPPVSALERFVPPPGSHAVLFADGPGQGTQCRHPMDLSAHPFGTGPAGTLDIAAMERRYGPCSVRRPDGLAGRYFFGLDAETILGLFNRLLSAQLGHVADIEETHDYAAVYPTAAIDMVQKAIGQAGGGKPGTPAITKLVSPGPGLVTVSWQTRRHDEYSLRLDATVGGSTTVSVVEPDTLQHTTTVPLAPGQGGTVSVAVVARLANQWGDWSRTKTVQVVPLGVVVPDPIDPDPVDPDPVDPDPTDPAPGCHEAALRSCLATCLATPPKGSALELVAPPLSAPSSGAYPLLQSATSTTTATPPAGGVQ